MIAVADATAVDDASTVAYCVMCPGTENQG